MYKSKTKPLYKPRKDLSVLQKRLMKEHKKHHTKKHLDMMTDLMKQGYCIEVAHQIATKKYPK